LVGACFFPSATTSPASTSVTSISSSSLGALVSSFRMLHADAGVLRLACWPRRGWFARALLQYAATVVEVQAALGKSQAASFSGGCA
jgi:hypothetical protein